MSEFEAEAVAEIEETDDGPGLAEIEVFPGVAFAPLLEEIVAQLGGTVEGLHEVVETDEVAELRSKVSILDVSPGDLSRHVAGRFAELDDRGLGGVAAWILTAFGECEQALPYAPQWERRNALGQRELTCGHAPEHVTVLA